MASTSNTQWEWRVDDDSDNLEFLLSKIIDDSVASSKVNTVELETELAKLTAKRTAWESKLTRRKSIEQSVRERLEKRQVELRKAQDAFHKARQKTRAVGYKVSQAVEDSRALSNTLGQEKLFLDNFAGIYTEDAFKNRAFMVMSLRERIDSSIPISFSHDRDQKKMRLSWVTGDIYINNSLEGGVWPFNFGQYRVEVTFSYMNGHRDARVLIRGHRRNTIVSGEYFHPHIRSDGTACLGNVARMLIEHMANQDVAQVICTVTEYLCHYNEQDPYRKLMFWGVANPYDLPHINMYQSHLVFDSGPKNPCGLSQSDCMVQHLTDKAGECSSRSLPAEVVVTATSVYENLQSFRERLNGEGNEETNG